MHKKRLIPFVGFKTKIETCTFAIVKNAANYAKIDRVGSLDAGLQQISESFIILLWNIDNIKSAKKSKIIYNKKFPKFQFTKEIE